MTSGLVQVAGGSWESTGEEWKKYPCWTCGKKYIEFDEREACKKSHPPDMKQVMMNPLGLDNYEPI